MTGERSEEGPSAGGLAEDLIPELRRRLGLSAGAPTPSPPAEGVLDFASELSAAAAATADAPDPATPSQQLVVFTLDRQRYGLAIEEVYQILRLATITRVPHAPRAICGVMNVRGRLLPVVDLRLLLDCSAAAVDKDTRVITVQVQGRWLGLLVDAVSSVVKISRDAVLEAPPEVIGHHAEFIRGVAPLAEGLVIIFDLERAFASNWRDR